MKRFAVLLMLVLFGFSSSGATVQLHYCCGELKKVTFGSVQEKDCGMVMEEEDSDACCETKSVSAQDKHQDNFYSINLGVKAPVEDQSSFHSITVPVVPQVVAVPPSSTVESRLSRSLLILHCVFRI